MFLEAFRNLTIKNAIQNNTENEVGSLSSGKLANFIILDKNPLLYNPAKYNEIQVYSIILEGKRLL
ncbi:MAG: amidohydrolase family protein [Spirochaetaceae bacterium]|nr:amidohydrolase family protein [Spirochaetaceae bacterium]